jgi:Aminoglycoside adenylyltransferase, C-terminal domain
VIAAPSRLDAATAAYAGELVERLRRILGDALLGAWIVGSGARDDYVPGRSDLDVAAAVDRPLSRSEKAAVVASCRQRALPCPAKGLELVLYRPATAPHYELNLNDGPAVPFHVSYAWGEDEPHWFVVDLAGARGGSRAVYGPPLADVLPEPDGGSVRAAVRAVLDWQERAEPVAANSVLNACRAWRWAATGEWTSKTEAAEWARDFDPGLIDAAVAFRRGEEAAPLDEARVRELLDRARAELQ